MISYDVISKGKLTILASAATAAYVATQRAQQLAMPLIAGDSA